MAGPDDFNTRAPTDRDAADGPTLDRDDSANAQQPRGAAGVTPAPVQDRPTSSTERYRFGEVIARGGMGEVVEAYDERVGRTVALKRMRDDRTGLAVARFLREARIQARLEHPSIVPVHDVGLDSAGRPYFTMKRLSGTTLYELLHDSTVSQQRLLRLLVDVCNALELAHSRGVVHRDVKPTNIMAGDFGEVYIIDWGIARVFDGSDVADVAVGEEQTRTNIALGTPRYMAPEQALGGTVKSAADVYALGAILFEILAGEPLRPDVFVDTQSIETPPVLPSARAPMRAIPPELDAVCFAALAVDPAARPTAKQLGRAIERYLDGDRDIERRRVLASQALAAARAAANSGEPARRGEAIQAAGRALALDPESRDAAALVSSLVLIPPAEQPAGLQAMLAATDAALVIRQRRVAVLALPGFFLFLPFAVWTGIKDVGIIAAIYALVAVLWISALSSVRRRNSSMTFAMIGQSVLIAMMSRVFGPFVLVPALAGVVLMALSASPPLTYRKWRVIGTMVATVVVPLALEQLGVLAPSWWIVDDRLVIASSVVRLAGTPAAVFVILANVAVIAVTGLMGFSLAASRHDAIRRAERQAWHLAQLLPRPGQ
jgi:serine/threonine-protein kinase